MKQFRSQFVQTVPDELYQSICAEVGEDFAGSYLPGARLDGQYLHPRTLTGYLKMRQSRDFMALCARQNLTLVKPTRFPGDGDRMTVAELTLGGRR